MHWKHPDVMHESFVGLFVEGLDAMSQIVDAASAQVPHQIDASNLVSRLEQIKEGRVVSTDNALDSEKDADLSGINDPEVKPPAVTVVSQCDSLDIDCMSMMEIFKLESSEHLGALNRLLTDLVAKSDDQEILAQLFRSAHTLKGAARIMDLADILSIAGALESLFGEWGKDPGLISQEFVNLCSDALKFVSIMIDAGAANQAYDVDVAGVVSGLEQAKQGIPTVVKQDILVKEEVATVPAQPDAAFVSDRDEIAFAADLGVGLDIDGMSMMDIFKMESSEHIEILNRMLLELENNPNDNQVIERLFRRVHTLKGAARIVEVSEVQSIAHAMEDLFGHLRKNPEWVNEAYISLSFQGLDAVTSIIDARLAHQPHKIDVTDLVDRLEAAKEERFLPPEYPQDNDQAAEPGGTPPMRAEEKTPLSRSAAEMPGKGKSAPSRSAGRPSPQTLFSDRRGQIAADDLGRERRLAAEQKMITQEVGDRTIRVDLQRMDRMMNLVGEIYTSTGHLHRWRRRLKELLRTVNHLHTEIGAINKLADKLGHDWAGRVSRNDFEMISVDELRNGLAGLGDIATMANQSFSQLQDIQSRSAASFEVIDNLSGNLEYLTGELQNEVLRARMLPANTLFSPYLRFVRDVMIQSGKKAQVIISGGETPVDRNILEVIKDPLMHLVRNSCDHGLERPEQRIRAGKNPQGTIYLRAYHRGDRGIIEVEDDGRGVDPEKVKKRILDGGLAQPDQVESMSKDDLVSFIFLHGFSTRETVSTTSGRGVGLDVVKTRLARISGYVQVKSEVGRMTRFTLSLPLTLAVIRCLLVTSGKSTVAIPLTQIDSLVTFTGKDITRIESAETLNHNGQLLSLAPLEIILGQKITSGKVDRRMAIVLSSAERLVALEVQGFYDERDVVVKYLDQRLGKIKNVAAATILENGDAAFILDVPEVIQSIADFTGSAVISKARETLEKTKKAVLVVEDSLTIRELEKKVLLAGGYDVDTAVDGVDGVMKAKQKHFDLVITDIDMPRMNGFEMIQTLKREKKYRNIPFIIVSYKQREEDKRRGMEVGASRYIVKSKYDSKHLLETIDQLIG
ncbi:MAG: Hpt domain-containing protein [Deltaproteobacteria bacterium]|nr:Hpt domain-containing protein [Deltaproteobacteria bacterium]